MKYIYFHYTFSDDEPDNGPQHYIIMTGFHDPHLIGFLNELGLNVDCIIKLESDEYVPVEETDSPPEVAKVPAPQADKQDGKELCREQESERIIK